MKIPKNHTQHARYSQLESLLSKLDYYILLIIVLLITLSILNVEGVLQPLENMVNEFLAFIPNLIAAAIIGFAGLTAEKTVMVARNLIDGLKRDIERNVHEIREMSIRLTA